MQCSNTLQMTGGFLLSGVSPQGAHFQVFPALPRTEVSLLFHTPSRRVVWCWFPGPLPVPTGSGVTRVHSPGQWLRPGQLVLALSPGQPLAVYWTALRVLFAKGSACVWYPVGGAALSFAEETTEPFAKLPVLSCLSSLSARKSILAPLPGPAQVGFTGGVLWYLGCKKHTKYSEREELFACGAVADG